MRTATISALIALAIGVSPINARQAHALTDSELLALLAGVAAVAIIGKEIRDDRNKASSVPSVSRSNIYGHGKRDGRYGKRDHRSLPAQCLRTFERSGRRDRQVLGAGCLLRNDVRLSRLPEACQVSVRTDRGYRNAYGARCVERNGWKIVDARRWNR